MELKINTEFSIGQEVYWLKEDAESLPWTVKAIYILIEKIDDFGNISQQVKYDIEDANDEELDIPGIDLIAVKGD